MTSEPPAESSRIGAYLLPGLVALLVVLAGCSGGSGGGQATGGQLGYSVGGAQDVNNFRDNVENGYLPQESAMTYHGLFSQYYFDTGKQRRCQALFCPSYSRAVSTDPLSNETERYMTVGLNSNLDAASFSRKKLNLVVVLDTSGSMSSGFAQYYYDGDERKTSERQPKIEAAKEALTGMLSQLNENDRVGIVTYSDGARTLSDVQAATDGNREKIRDKVAGISAGGGTNLDAGRSRARRLLSDYANADTSEYETRIIYLTDAMPNLGDTSGFGLAGALEDDAETGIHSTFVGVGIDFNNRLAERITNVRGANYYSVHSAAQFNRRMDREFEYMVTPMVYNLTLTVEADGYEIKKVYGTPDADDATGELLHADTLFPTPTRNGSAKGGVILVELEKTGAADSSVTLTATYEDRAGEHHRTTRTVTFSDADPEYFENSGIRKAVLLSRYGDLMNNWVSHERTVLSDSQASTPDDGIAPHTDRDLGQWEQRSTDLQVSSTYRTRFREFRPYMHREIEALGDNDLRQELDLVDQLIAHNQSTSTDTTTAKAG